MLDVVIAEFQERQLSTQPENCSEFNIRYGVIAGSYCTDKYVEYKNGVAIEKQCPNGMYFNENISVDKYPCQHSKHVNCIIPIRPRIFQVRR